MRQLTFFVVLILFLSVAAFGQREKGRVSGELLVKFRPGTSAEVSRSINLKNGGVKLERFADLEWERVRIPAGKSLESAMEEYLSSPQVAAVQPNFYYNLLATEVGLVTGRFWGQTTPEYTAFTGVFGSTIPNDPSFSSLWGMTKISAPDAWSLNTGSSTVVVADIDTGIRYNHEDLAANMWTNPGEINNNGLDDDNNGFVDDYYGYDFFFNDPNPMDENGHGTHTAGTIGAVGNNSLGVAGVNWNVRLMAIKIYDNDGFGTTSAMLINAYNYVRMMKNRGINIRVTNNSYGGCDEACGYDQATKDAIDALGNAGVLQVFAAGNDGMNIDITPSYPAAYNSPWIISVANSTSSDARNGSSNFGVANVDLAAPGTGILSTILSAANYGNLSGTSMATPHVAGAAALLAAHNPLLSSSSLKATLLNTVDQLAAWNGVVKTGGRLNVGQALQNQTACSFNLSGSPIAVPTKGGSFAVNVTAGTNCDFQVKSNAPWIKILGPDSFSGNASPSFWVTVNPAISRSGTINVAGTTITVTQSRS